MGSPEANLWVCHLCEMIGSRREAHEHHADTGHPIEMLDTETSAAVRDMRLEEQARRVAAYQDIARGRLWTVE